MKLILHLGAAKCGSTFIQSYLHKHKAHYASRGLVSFDQGDGSKGNVWTNAFFVSIKDGIKNHKDLLGQIDLIKNKNPEADKLIISDEFFIHLTEEHPGIEAHQVLKNHFDDISIIYYIRRQDDFLLSAYQEWGHRQGLTIDRYIKDCIQSFKNFSPFYHMVHNIIDIYGKDKIYIRPINKDTLLDGSLIKDFCKASDIEYVDDLAGIYSNKGLNIALCDSLSRVPGVFSSVHDRHIREVLEEASRATDILFSKHSKLLSPQKLNDIMRAFSDQNIWLHKTFFSHLNYEDIYGERCEDNFDELTNRIDNLENMVSLQFDLILQLLDQKQKKG